MIVVDAGVLAVALTDNGFGGTKARDRLSHEELAAPELVDVEVVSVIRKLLRTGRISERAATASVRLLGSMPIHRASHAPLLSRCWALRDNLTPYDAAYVALAEALDVTLVTVDARLAHSPGPRCHLEILR